MCDSCAPLCAGMSDVHTQLGLVCVLFTQGDKSVELLVQLKLNENIKNNFEFFEVHLPFLNRYCVERKSVYVCKRCEML